jgi:hypothetical protein
MSDAEQMRKNAENCEELAAQAVAGPDRARFKRMRQSWDNLANTQDWLDGKAPAPTANGHADNQNENA